MVVDNIFFDLLFVFAVINYMENQNFAIFMEGAGGDSNNGVVVCNKLDINKICF